MSALDLTMGWSVANVRGDEPAMTATAELDEVLTKITGRPSSPHAKGVRFDLNHGDGPDDGFRWEVGDGNVSLYGDNGRGLLYAVFDFLEALGCLWPGPGVRYEQIPRQDRFEIGNDQVHRAPSLPGRCLILGSESFAAEADDWIVWAVRNRLNTVFVHIDPPTGGFGGAIPVDRWEKLRDGVMSTVRRYGLVFELGGHGMAALLSRDLFASEPGAFRSVGGVRMADHNLCPSSPVALAIVREGARIWFQDNPDVDVFHLWPDDLPGGGWCDCAECAGISSSDQSLRVTNELADVLADVRPGALLAHLAYQDSLDIPEAEVPRPNVVLLWAPRQRCYAHRVDDATCAINGPREGAGYGDLVRWFADHGAAGARVFEYYLDAILFKALVPPLPTVISGDLDYYRTTGAHTVQALLVGPRRFLSPPVNAWLFARLAWDTSDDPDRLLNIYADALGCPVGRGADYFRALERAFLPALDLHPDQVPKPESFAAFLQDPFSFLIERGLSDMDDPENLPLAQLTARFDSFGDSLTEVSAAQRMLEDQTQNTSDPRDERAELDLASKWIGFARGRLAVHRALGEGAPPSVLRERIRSCIDRYGGVVRWARTNLSPVESHAMERLLWLFWRASLYRIELAHLGGEDEDRRVHEERANDVGRLLMAGAPGDDLL